MKIAFCLDDDNGLLFNGRRLSRDSAVINDLIDSLPPGEKLRILPFSLTLFRGLEDRVSVCDSIDGAGTDELCFVESIDASAYTEYISTLTVYRWNRRYPSDMKLTMSLEHFRLISQTDFPGSSHERITKEVYIPCVN